MDASLSNYVGTSKVFDSNLPLVFVDSFGINVDGSTGGVQPYRTGYAVVIQPDPATGRALTIERIQRLGDGPGSGTGGVGLGLAVARAFTTAMGGTLEVNDTRGGGAAFTFRFPTVAEPAEPGPPRGDGR